MIKGNDRTRAITQIWDENGEERFTISTVLFPPEWGADYLYETMVFDKNFKSFDEARSNSYEGAMVAHSVMVIEVINGVRN